MRIAVLSSLLAAFLLITGTVSFGCCDISCADCPPAFCKESPELALAKAFVPAPSPATLHALPLLVRPVPGPEGSPAVEVLEVRGFAPPLRN